MSPHLQSNYDFEDYVAGFLAEDYPLLLEPWVGEFDLQLREDWDWAWKILNWQRQRRDFKIYRTNSLANSAGWGSSRYRLEIYGRPF